MPEVRFEWDEAKNLFNQRKHGVSFEEASRVFFDPLHIVVDDRDVDGEQRWLALGLIRRDAGSFLLLVVAHTVHEDEENGDLVEIFRIISARRAVPEERRIYEEENG